MEQTAMQELKSDLILTKETTKNSFSEIKNQEIKDACIKVVEMTLNSIITRIDTELLAMEKEHIISFLKWVGDGYDFQNNAKEIVNEYYNETFKSE